VNDYLVSIQFNCSEVFYILITYKLVSMNDY